MFWSHISSSFHLHCGLDSAFHERSVHGGEDQLYLSHRFMPCRRALKDNRHKTRKRIAYGVYPKKIYFLNTDTVKERTFTYEIGGKKKEMTLKPCEIVTVRR